MASLKSFAPTDRFVAEIATPAIRPGYVLLGDEIFLYDRCRKAGGRDELASPRSAGRSKRAYHFLGAITPLSLDPGLPARHGWASLPSGHHQELGNGRQ